MQPDPTTHHRPEISSSDHQLAPADADADADVVSVPGRKRWTPPDLTAQQRVELAREWLTFLRQDVTEQRVQDLAPVVMSFHPLSPKGQIANKLVRRGLIPTPEAVRDEAARRAEARHKAKAAPTAKVTPPTKKPRRRVGPPTRMTPVLRATAAQYLSPAACEQLRAFVADTRATTGAGPAWSQVRKHMGWTTQVGTRILRAAIGAGVLTGTVDPNSLDLGPHTHVPPIHLEPDTATPSPAPDQERALS